MTDIEIGIMVKNMAREMVGEMRTTAKNAETIKMDGKEYRCVRPPRSEADYGQWEFFYNGKWHEVLNYGIRKQLNEKLKK